MSEEVLKIDAERHQINQITQSLFHNALYQYIADANRYDVLNSLFEFFDKADAAVISKQKLRYYQELEKLSLDKSMFEVNNKNG